MRGRVSYSGQSDGTTRRSARSSHASRSHTRAGTLVGVPLLLALLLLPLAVVALTPLILIQRYRLATARRLARPWIATITLVSMLFSVMFFVVAAAMTTYWIPNAFSRAVAGLGVGSMLGVLGLVLTRWEPTPRTLHYTPNRWLVLVLTFVVSARVIYGFWRSWAVVQSGLHGTSVVTAFGVPESLAAGATVLGYYLVYSAGLRWRIRRWQQRVLRVM